MAEELPKEVQQHIVSYTKDVIAQLSELQGFSGEEEVDKLIEITSNARSHFIQLEAEYSPNVRNKEINDRLNILVKVQYGAVSEKRRIIEALEYQNMLSKRGYENA